MKLELYKEIRKYLKEIISNTKFEHMTYCVGGCCRDEILGNEIKDIDIVVELENGGIELAQYLYENHFTRNKNNGILMLYYKRKEVDYGINQSFI